MTDTCFMNYTRHTVCFWLEMQTQQLLQTHKPLNAASFLPERPEKVAIAWLLSANQQTNQERLAKSCTHKANVQILRVPGSGIFSFLKKLT